jgi:hypothetical protein
MNTSTTQTRPLRAPILPAMPEGWFANIEPNNGNALPSAWEEIDPKIKTFEFRGKLEIPGILFTIPEQEGEHGKW